MIVHSASTGWATVGARPPCEPIPTPVQGSARQGIAEATACRDWTRSPGCELPAASLAGCDLRPLQTPDALQARLRARLAPLSGPVGRTRNDRGRGFYDLANYPHRQRAARPDSEETPRSGHRSPAHVTRYPGGVAASARQANERRYRIRLPGTPGPRACVTGAGLQDGARARGASRGSRAGYKERRRPVPPG